MTCWQRSFLRGDQPIGLDETVTNPALASFLNQLGDGGIDAMYRGEIASQIVERVDSLGGYLTKADLAAHRTLDMKPSSTDFAGATCLAAAGTHTRPCGSPRPRPPRRARR